MDRVLSYIIERTKSLEKGVAFLTYLTGASLAACYILNRKVKKLNDEIKDLQARE